MESGRVQNVHSNSKLSGDIENFKKAARRANMYYFHITVLDTDQNFQSAEGTLSKVDEETLLSSEKMKIQLGTLRLT